MTVIIRDFVPADQTAARTLILTGLGEHWGWIDETRNPDVDDIAVNYAGQTFLVAEDDGQLIGTGALIHETDDVARVVRMSVAAEVRRQGLGSQLLDALIVRARQRGYRKIVLETTATWTEVIAFYQRHGFRELGVADGDMHFERLLR
ncbi:MAG: GNAT family N-acetyltransferase [Anaerolineae bacterium]|nr:GNAT family N-acetyltransferase [Anaerolineae bacterium]